MYINKNTLSDLIQFSNNSYNTNYKCSFVFRHCGYGTSSSLDNIIQTITLHYKIQIQFHNENNPLSSFISDKLITNHNLSITKNNSLFISNEYTLLQCVIDILHIKDT